MDRSKRKEPTRANPQLGRCHGHLGTCGATWEETSNGENSLALVARRVLSGPAYKAQRSIEVRSIFYFTKEKLYLGNYM